MKQLIFVPNLLAAEDIRWIQHRKVVYILPKVPRPTISSDYRPLSMLETALHDTLQDLPA